MSALPDPGFWRGRRVLLTGHTGFKGTWLALWLAELGAHVHGLSAPPPTEPSLYEQARARETLAGETTCDIRDREAVASALREADPELVLHLAAQAIVRRALVDPVETWGVNVLGTANVLGALPDGVRGVVVVTSDKCYRDVASGRRMCEDDPLGGRDPYSASKAAQELVASSFRDTVLAERGIAVATARAGNVFGGGDWAADRLIPDIMRARARGEPVTIRNPDAVRPWQHVLNPLSGYLVLAERLARGEAAEAWNFGPDAADERPVRWIVERLGVPARVRPDPDAHKESPSLRLDSAKARERLGWVPRWGLAQALDATVEWHSAAADHGVLSRAQVDRFMSDGRC